MEECCGQSSIQEEEEDFFTNKLDLNLGETNKMPYFERSLV
jgi:hypothetical protein